MIFPAAAAPLLLWLLIQVVVSGSQQVLQFQQHLQFQQVYFYASADYVLYYPGCACQWKGIPPVATCRCASFPCSPCLSPNLYWNVSHLLANYSWCPACLPFWIFVVGPACQMQTYVAHPSSTYPVVWHSCAARYVNGPAAWVDYHAVCGRNSTSSSASTWCLATGGE